MIRSEAPGLSANRKLSGLDGEIRPVKSASVYECCLDPPGRITGFPGQFPANAFWVTCLSSPI